MLPVFLLGGCSPQVEVENSGGSAVVLPSNEDVMTRNEFGKDWPLTVDEGIVRCEGAGEVYFEAEGIVYPVNGTAQGVSDGPDIEQIWADDPDYKGLKINIGPIIDRGLDLCE